MSEVFIVVKAADGDQETLWIGKVRGLCIQESRNMTHHYGPNDRVEQIVPGEDVFLSMTGTVVPPAPGSSLLGHKPTGS